MTSPLSQDARLLGDLLTANRTGEEEHRVPLDMPQTRRRDTGDTPSERVLDYVHRVLSSLGGSGSYRSLHYYSLPVMLRPTEDTPGNRTPLDAALAEGLRRRFLAVDRDGYQGTYHLTDLGAAWSDLPSMHLRDRVVAYNLTRELAAYLSRSPETIEPGHARLSTETIARTTAKLAVMASLAAVRNGTVRDCAEFWQQVSAAFHDVTRGDGYAER